MQSSNTKVSVVIPCFNGERFIGEAIESVLAQTHRDLEIIVVDDGSSDRSREVVMDYASGGRVRYTRHDVNRGIPAARNTGIRLSDGDFVAFLDQDDLWRPEKLSREIAAFESRKNGDIGLVFSNMGLMNRHGVLVKDTCCKVPKGINGLAREQVVKALFMRNFIPIITVLVKRECFERVGFLDETISSGSDDYEFCLRLAREYDIAYVDEALAVRRLHEDNYTNDELIIPDAISVIEKFAAEISCPASLRNRRISNLLSKLGGFYVRTGEMTKGMDAFRRSLEANRMNLKSRLGYLACKAGPVGGGVARLWFNLRSGNLRRRS
jgi:glycosyltransferase involved in cell wall biosynthesis